MADLLQNGMNWLSGQMQDHASQSVAYEVVGEVPLSIKATLGHSEVEEISAGGSVIQVKTRDFIFLTADLMIDDAPVKPTEAHRIVWSGKTYQPLPIGDGACYDDSDHHGIMTRVHTKLVATD